MKVLGNKEIVRETYKIINALCLDFINIYNGFNFDLRCLVAFSEKRLSNVRVV